MKRNYLKLIAVAALALGSVAANAQNFLTTYFMESNHLRHQNNPALLDTAYMTVPLFGNLGAGALGNVGADAFAYDVTSNGRRFTTSFMHSSVSTEEFLSKLEDLNKMNMFLNWGIVSNANYRWGGVNIFEMRLKHDTKLTAPRELFAFMKEPDAKNEYDIRDLALRSNTYLEFGFGHSHAIGDRVKIGAKGKLLVGLAYIDFGIDKFHVKHHGLGEGTLAKGGLVSVNGHVQIGTVLGGGFGSDDDEYDYDDKEDDSVDFSDFDVDSFGAENLSLGFGLDLGATVKVIDGLEASISLIDLGFVKYKAMANAYAKGEVEFEGFENSGDIANDPESSLGDQLDAILDDLGNAFELKKDGSVDQSFSLPTAMNIGLNYKMPFYDKLSAGVLYNHRFDKLAPYNQTMVIFDVYPCRWVEVALNTAFTSTGVSAGFACGVNLGSFSIAFGTDRLHTAGYNEDVMIPNDNFNTDFNFSLSFKKKKK